MMMTREYSVHDVDFFEQITCDLYYAWTIRRGLTRLVPSYLDTIVFFLTDKLELTDLLGRGL